MQRTQDAKANSEKERSPDKGHARRRDGLGYEHDMDIDGAGFSAQQPSQSSQLPDALITEQGQIWWKESSRTAPHLTLLSSKSTRGSPATRAFGQQAPVAAVSSAPYMAWFSRFSIKRKCFLMVETSQPFSKTRPSQWVAARAQCTDRMSRDET